MRAVIAALTGLKTSVLSEFESFGANKMFILHDYPRGEPRSKYPFSKIRITIDELHAIDEHCPSIRQLTPVTGVGGTVEAGEEKADSVRATGIWPTWHEIEARPLLMGRPFTNVDEENARQVYVQNYEHFL